MIRYLECKYINIRTIIIIRTVNLCVNRAGGNRTRTCERPLVEDGCPFLPLRYTARWWEPVRESNPPFRGATVSCRMDEQA